jgi:Carboxypeptidase regulatory-like domain
MKSNTKLRKGLLCAMNSFLLRKIGRFQNLVGIVGVLFLGTVGSLMIFNGRTALAQSINASIAGTITDPSGALVPGASVKLTNQGTGVRLTTETNSAGRYAFPAVPPGATYSLTVTKAGFQEYDLTQFQVIAGQALSENAALKLGAAEEKVTVTAGGLVQLLESGSNDLGNVIAPQAVEQLPLNGRNFLQLALLSGATLPTGLGDDTVASQVGVPSVAINIGGNNNDFTGYLINGVEVRGTRAGNVGLNISPSAVEEFKVHYGFFMPDLGAGPGVVSVITKSGTNSFHGEVYEFIRNNILDARDFFSPQPLAPFKQNQFGGSLGGPIRKDKDFFFFNYEGMRQIQNTFSSGFAPTQAMFNGDLSALPNPIYNPFQTDPNTGARIAFPGNIIPAGDISPVAKKLLAYYKPGSSFTATPNNVFGNPRHTFNSDQITVRVDENLSDRNSIFGEYNYQNALNQLPGLFPLTGQVYPFNTNVGTIGWTSTLSSTKLNEFRLAFYRDDVFQQGIGQSNIQQQLGITGTADGNGVPAMGFSGAFSGFGGALSQLGDVDDAYELHDAFSWLRGNHQIKFGTDISYYRSSQLSSTGNARGTFNFTGQFTSQISQGPNNQIVVTPKTGNAFADFLLGVPTSAATVSMPLTHYRWTTQQTYVEDTWKVRHDLTMNIGLGYFINTAPNPVGSNRNYPHSFNFQTGQITFAALGQIPPQVYSTTFTDVAPRVGLAWQPSILKNTSVRAGWGIYYATQNFFDSQFSIVGPGVTLTQSITNGQPNPKYVFGQNVLPPLTLSPITSQFAQTASGTLFYVPPHNPNPYVEQWTLDLQHSFGREYLIDVAYLGSEAHHTRNQWDANDCAVAGTAAGTWMCDTSATPVPYSKFPYILETANTAGSSYQALLMKFERQFNNGLSVLGNYTFSKTLATGNQGGFVGGVQAASCFQCEKGLARYSVPQSLVVSTVWDLPVGRGRKLLSNMNPVLNEAIGGWGTDFIASFQGGNPITPTAPNFTAFTFRIVRPNRLCNGRNEVKNKNLRSNGLVYFDSSCFVTPPTNYFGNSGNGIFYGPGISNWDIALRKVFPIRENVRLLFRTEFFNAFNHAQFGSVSSSITSSSFGRVTSTQMSPREIQFAAKVQF